MLLRALSLSLSQINHQQENECEQRKRRTKLHASDWDVSEKTRAVAKIGLRFVVVGKENFGKDSMLRINSISNSTLQDFRISLCGVFVAVVKINMY